MNLNRRFAAFATRTFNPSHWLTAIKRKAARVEVVAISLLLMPVILVMADHLPFVDVSSGAFYHGAVSAVYGARITTGTSPTTFSPEDLVTRDQMAVFLHRGLGRVAYDFEHAGTYHYLTTTHQEIASVTVNTGEAIGGTGFLKVDATLNIDILDDSNCPCDIQYYLDASDGPNSHVRYLSINDNPVPNHSYTVSGAITWAFPVETGIKTQRVRLIAKVVDSSGTPFRVQGIGSITAIYVPFGSTGANTLSAASSQEGDAPPGTEPDSKPDLER